MELFDQVDTYNARNLTPTSYTPAIFKTEAAETYWSSPAYHIGPGLTENAGKEWMDLYN